MASRVESVLLPARLTGMNLRVTCGMHALKISQPESDEVTYSRLKIVGAPLDLPDGSYIVRYAGLMLKVRRRKGVWIGTD